MPQSPGTCGGGWSTSQAWFRFYAGLNDFLPPPRRGVAFPYVFQGRPSVKDAVEALGVPHVEVDLLLADGESVDFSFRLRDGAHVSVYPVFQSLAIGSLSRVRPAPLPHLRFVLDGHLGRLAAYLQLLGLDVVHRHDVADAELVRLSSEECRVLLTRDRGLLRRSAVTHGYFVREIRPRPQLVEVLHRFDVRDRIAPFSRCLVCNSPLEPVPEEQVRDRLRPRVRARRYDLVTCRGCDRVYWPGSHFQRMRELVDGVLAEAGQR